MARAEGGTWLALDGQAILQTYRLAAGYLYEAQVRHELTRRLGLAWTELMKGVGELERVPEEATRAFSSRRQALVVLVPSFDLRWKQRDCGSRPSKGVQGMRRLRARVG